VIDLLPGVRFPPSTQAAATLRRVYIVFLRKRPVLFVQVFDYG
jgi:hypothetical protein